MRFEKLTIQNINSWNGKHFFDFQEILKGEDLFAITGPTGSGKSTILLSLSLALYGRGPKGLDAQDYISMGQEEASVELISTIRGKCIRAQWTIQKGKTPKRSVWIDDKAVSRPKTAIEELIGLNFDQFSKTIILNQGEFSRFLTSSFTERKEILEHLSGIHELSSLIDELKKKRQIVNQEWELIYNQIESLPKNQFTNNEELIKAQVENENLIQLNEKQQSENEKLNNAIKSYNEFSIASEKISQKICKQEEILKAIHPQITESRKNYDQSQIDHSLLVDKANQLRPLFERGLIIENNLNIKNQNLSIAQDKTKKLHLNLKHLIENLSKKNEQLISIKQNLEILSSPLSTLSDHDKTKASLLFNQMKENKQELLYLDELSKKINEQKRKSEETLKFSQNKLQELSKVIVEINPNGQSLNSLRDLLHHKNSATVESKQVSLLIKEKREKLTNEKRLQQKLLNEFEKLTHEFEQFNTQSKKSQLEHALKICFEASVEAGHCLLCGHDKLPHSHQSIENWVESEAEVFNEQVLRNCEVQVLTKKEKISHLQNELNTLEIRLHSLDISDDASLLKLKQQISQIEEIDRTIIPLQSLIPLQKEQIEKAINDSKENKNKQAQTNEKIITLFKDLQNVISIENTEILFNQWEDWQSIEQKRQSLKIELLQVENNVEQIKLQQDSSNEQLKVFEVEISDLKNQIDSLTQELYAISKGRPIRDCQNDLETSLAKSLQENTAKEKIWRELTQKRDMEANTLSILGNDLKTCQIDVINSKTKISKILKEVSPLLTINNETIDLVKLLSPESDWNASIIQEIYQLKLIPFMEQLRREYEQLAEKRGMLKSKIEEFQKFEKYHRELNEKFAKINSQKDIFEELYSLMVKGDFRGFALSFIEESLVTLANHELDLLCGGRYRLIQQKDSSKSQVDFMILDSLHGGEARKISTLSGGETFMVSLGLALALSEMMRGKTEIDSFFIDEGFGALDPDSIEEVLEILFNVQMRGKTIGLISHVKSLTSRIPINIELSKNQLGHSEFRIHKN